MDAVLPVDLLPYHKRFASCSQSVTVAVTVSLTDVT